MNAPKPSEPLPELSKEDYELLAEFRYLLRRFLEFSGKAAQGAGLTPPQHQALLAIKGYPGRDQVTVRELAARLCIRHHSAVGLIDRLVARGMVVRRVDSNDRRHVLIELTPDAEAILVALSVAHRSELRRLAPLLKPLLSQM